MNAELFPNLTRTARRHQQKGRGGTMAFPITPFCGCLRTKSTWFFSPAWVERAKGLRKLVIPFILPSTTTKSPLPLIRRSIHTPSIYTPIFTKSTRLKRSRIGASDNSGPVQIVAITR